MDPTYDRIVGSLKAQHENSVALALNTLCWLTKAHRTLTINELQIAVAVQPNASKLDEEFVPHESVLRDICAGLVVIDDQSGTVRLVHFTVQQYILRKNVLPRVPESILAIGCTTYLAFDIFGDDTSTSADSLRERLNANPLLDYATRYFTVHIRSCDEDLTKYSFLRFLQRKRNVNLYVRIFALNEGRINLYSPQITHSPLHLAAEVGHCSVLEVLIGKRIATNDVDEEGRTALHYAAKEGQVNAVRLLLGKGYECDKKDQKGSTPLHHAAVRGQTVVIAELLSSGANPSVRDIFGTASQNITSEKHIPHQVDGGQILTFCFPAIPNLSSRSTLLYHHGTALHRAIEKGQMRAVECFLEKNRDLIELTDGKGQTLLHWAAKGSHYEIVRFLLEKGANVHAVDDMHQTALHCVAAVGPAGENSLRVLGGSAEHVPRLSKDRAEPQGSHEKTICILLESELDVDAKDITGSTALLLAAHFGHEITVRLLIDGNADKEARENDRVSSTAAAAGNGHHVIVQVLLDKGVDVNSKDDHQRTPLHWAAQHGCEKTIQLLLQSGSRVQENDKNKCTALHLAAYFGHTAAIRVLLQYTTDINALDYAGLTPLLLAIQMGRRKSVNILVRKEIFMNWRHSKFRTALLQRTLKRALGGARHYALRRALENFLHSSESTLFSLRSSGEVIP